MTSSSEPSHPSERPASIARGIAKGFLSISAGNIVSRGINFLTVIYLGRRFGPDGFGAIGLAQAALVLGSITGDLGLQTLGIRVSAQEPEEAGRILSNYVSLRFCLSTLSVALLAGFALVSGQSAVVTELTMLFGLTLIATALTTEWLFIGLQRMEYVGTARILQSASYGILLVTLVRGGNDIFLVPILVGVSILTSATFLFWAFRRFDPSFRFRPTPSSWPGLLRTALPLGLSDALLQTYISLPVLMIGWFHDERATGFFSAAFRLVQVLNDLLGLLFISFYPTVASRWKHAPSRVGPLLDNVMKLMLVVTLPVAAGAVVLGPSLLTALLGARFGPSVLSFQILVWNVVAAAISGVYKMLVLLMNGKQREYLLVIALTAGLGVALNLGFIWLWSYNGAAIARVATDTAAAAISAIIARRFVRMRFWGAFVRVCLATAATALAWFGLGAIGLPVWLVIPAGAALYVPALFLFGAINSQDAALFRSILRIGEPRPATTA